jgi:beta-glucosidase/6-phospho-beta-glucosidase/beta-galactosidase
VAAAKGNLPFDYGIQADPRGSTSANVGLIRGMGFNWVKFQMAWKDVEPSAGGYSWGMWDEVIGAYAANGIKVMLSIPKSPDWARPPDDDRSVEGPPADPATYANFVGQVAARYKGKVQAIEVWNEQNLYYEAGGQGAHQSRYLHRTAQTILQRYQGGQPGYDCHHRGHDPHRRAAARGHG